MRRRRRRRLECMCVLCCRNRGQIVRHDHSLMCVHCVYMRYTLYMCVCVIVLACVCLFYIIKQTFRTVRMAIDVKGFNEFLDIIL